MPQQSKPSVINNFNQGFKTEFTGLNFPENACTDTTNCVFDIIGNVSRREGIDYELNKTTATIDRTTKAISTYKWNNVGGDGLTQIVVTQVGDTLRFFRSSSATAASPLSTTILGSTVTISGFVAAGGSFDSTIECQFVDGNGYLFVFHPSCDPFYCVYNAGTVTGTAITIKIRDFAGLPDNLDIQFRPPTLSVEHQYNLSNQGWTTTPPWTASTGQPATIGPVGASNTFSITVESNTTSITNGRTVNGIFTGQSTVSPNPTYTASFAGTVTAYAAGGNITLTITVYQDTLGGTSMPTGSLVNRTCSLSLQTTGYVGTWFSGIGNYPSNSDIWYTYKNSSGVFSPSTTVNNILPSGSAPKGNSILSAFIQQRSSVSGIVGLTNITTTVRPRTGTFFQGRVWYSGVDAAQQATGDAPYTTWTENIYFSQVIENTTQFGYCYQTNDPTNETFFDLLPTDGGVIVIQGSGSIYKLFPIHNGLLVFAANGIWLITGSVGIGFTANDYTIAKISSVRSMSSTSFVDVQGTPFWWNEEGIYSVSAGTGDEPVNYGSGRGSAATPGFSVNNLCLGTILSFYSDIPLQSKKYVRGYYHPLDYVIQWVYRDTNESTVTDRYQFNTILNYNTATKAFYSWTIANTPFIHDVMYVASPGGSSAPAPVFKYLTSASVSGANNFTFSEQRDSTHWVDWYSTDSIGDNYTSSFTSGYRIKGNAQNKFQTEYVYLYLNNYVNMSYKFQAIWDYAISGNSGKFSNLEQTVISDSTANFGIVRRRHRVRGRGLVNQFRITSVNGQPFDFIGWSVDDKVNTGI